MKRTKELDNLAVKLSAQRIVSGIPSLTGNSHASKETLVVVIELLTKQLGDACHPEEPGWKQLSEYPNNIEALLTEYVTRQAIAKLKNGEIG